MTRKIVLAVVIVLLITGGLVGIKALQVNKLMQAGKSFAVPPESVSSTIVRQQKWQETLTAIGSVVAIQGVTISPELAGTIADNFARFEITMKVQIGYTPLSLAGKNIADRLP